MQTRRGGVVGWLQGRETGHQSTQTDQNGLSHMLYSSADVHGMWVPGGVTNQESHGGIFNFDFSPDGAVLVAACEKKSFLVFDPNNSKLVNTRRRAHVDCVNCVRFLDTRSFVTCSDDSTVVLWDLRFLKNKVRTLEGHSNWVKNIEYASSQGVLITSGFDGSVYSWNINNYSRQDDAKRLFHLEGLMRCKLAPDETKLVISTSRGYLVIIHDLDLAHLSLNMDSFKSGGNTGSRLRSIVSNFSAIFKRPKNRLEIVNDFPVGDPAENIASLQVHPQGWCALSRNTSFSETSEWTCVHDIHTEPALIEEEYMEDNSLEGPSNGTKAHTSCARTSPPAVIRWDSCAATRPEHFPRRPLYQRALREDLPAVNPTVPAVVMSSTDEDDSDDEDEEYDVVSVTSSESDSDWENGDSRNHLPGRNYLRVNSLYHYFMRTQRAGNLRRTRFNLEEIFPLRLRQGMNAGEAGSDLQHQEPLANAHQEAMAAIRLIQQENILLGEISPSSPRLVTESFLTSPSSAFEYQSQPRLIYAQQEPNVGRGYIKEQCFSSDGRLIVSPSGNGVCLMSFDSQCRELCDCRPPVAGRPRFLHKLKTLKMHSSVVLTTCFSPTRPLFVSGSLDGSVAFITPSL